MKIARLILCCALVAATAHNALGEDRARARSAFRQGSQHYNLGEFPQALESFKEAYRNYESAEFLYNIAQCERQLGHKREAVREYRAYLNNAENPDNREFVKQTIQQLEKQITDDDDKQRAQTATPATEPAQAQVASPTTQTIQTSVAPSTAALRLTAAAPVTRETKPAYKKWWVWTIVGGIAAAGAATGIAIAFTRQSTPSAPTSLGTAHPSF